jgi:ubiquinol-cytochrome c reductase iron-sulfur subunit
MSDSSSIKRRKILSGLMKLLVFIGFIFISIPFFSSFSSNLIDEKQKNSSRWIITLPVIDLVEGEVKSFPWSGGLVWVYARTEKDVQLLNERDSSLRDPVSAKSDQPEEMKNIMRSAHKRFFVFIPNENKRSCQVSLNAGQVKVRFTEPCYGAKYDAAGRIFENSGHKDKTQQNLAVPEHVIEDGILKIGVWMPKI